MRSRRNNNTPPYHGVSGTQGGRTHSVTPGESGGTGGRGKSTRTARGAPPSPGMHSTPRRAPGRMTLSSDERAAAIELAEKRRSERSQAFHARDYFPAERRAIVTSGGIDFKALAGRSREFVRDLLAKLSVSRESVLRGLIIAVLMVVFALTQTTLFTRLPPFGAVPDLMLSFCIAVAVTEGEHWGAVTALFAAFVITALGAVSFDPAPLLYLVCAYTAGVLSRYYLKQNVLTRSVYTVAAGICRAAATFAALTLSSPSYEPLAFLRLAIIPEFFSTLLLAPIIHIIVWSSLHVFHRSRAERTGTQD